MISPGPCIAHRGSRVSMGVKVKVGEGVAEGEEVDVSVGEDAKVAVTVWVGEGIGVAVEVGSIVGVGETLKLNPSHPMRTRANPVIPIQICRKRFQRMIQIP